MIIGYMSKRCPKVKLKSIHAMSLPVRTCVCAMYKKPIKNVFPINPMEKNTEPNLPKSLTQKNSSQTGHEVLLTFAVDLCK